MQSYGLVSKNPVLKNITDYLVEEGSYEEEELLGKLANINLLQWITYHFILCEM